MTHSACTRCNAAEGDTERYILVSMRWLPYAAQQRQESVWNDPAKFSFCADVVLMFNQIDILSSGEIEHSSLFAQHILFCFFPLCAVCTCVCCSHISRPNIELMLNNARNMMWTEVNLCIFRAEKSSSSAWRECRTQLGNKQVSVISGSVISMQWNGFQIRTNSRSVARKMVQIICIYCAAQNRKFTWHQKRQNIALTWCIFHFNACNHNNRVQNYCRNVCRLASRLEKFIYSKWCCYKYQTVR